MVPVLIVPILNRYDLLDRCIASIDYPVGVLMVIDNGDSDWVYQSNPYVGRVVVWRVPNNLGCCTSWNFGIVANQMAPWWLISGNDNVFEPGALETFVVEARRDAVVLSASHPRWTAFTIGDEVVQKVGLFDDNYHPCYFDDNDFTMRCKALGVDVVDGHARVKHDNSSTIHSDSTYFDWNQKVIFPASNDYYQNKLSSGDFTAGRFDLERRRRCTFPQKV